MNWTRVIAPLACVCLCAVALPPPDDYSFMWWAYGWRGRSPDNLKILSIQTSRYGLALDVERPAITHLGTISRPMPYDLAVAQSSDVIFELPESKLSLSITIGEDAYVCVSAASDQSDRVNFPVRIIESGRFMQRADMLQLVFENAAGDRLEAEGRLEVAAWPDMLSLLMDIIPRDNLDSVSLRIDLHACGEHYRAQTEREDLVAGHGSSVALSWIPDGHEQSPREKLDVTVAKIDGEPVPVRYDARRGLYDIDLPEATWSVPEEPDRLDRYALSLTNTTDAPAVFRLLFCLDGSIPGLIGLSPMLRDVDGAPTGIPVQISKNWHRQAGRTFLYQGPWFHGFTMVPVEAGATWRGEFAMAYARWGGVPAASHAQLCLIGWGTNQLWDQAAIGSWGESICYDPDVNLGRSMIDDIRPLMVTNMRTDDGKWGWTANVGGGDFLVYIDDVGERQYLSRVRTGYRQYGPNLTKVTYAGVSADGKIAARIDVSSPRCDDLNRAYHRIRYDVLKPTPFTRLAFYQLGADGYNDHQFDLMARGNAEAGLLEEWQPERGGLRYHRAGMLCDGPVPWFSLHGGRRNEAHPRGAWANRGLIIRSWRARLGGRDVPSPFASSYGTENGVPSANVELSPPPGCTELEAGDFVEAELELVVIPLNAGDYYGPNENLRAHLAEHANTWCPVWRQARGNDLRVSAARGTLKQHYPVVVEVDNTGAADVEVLGGIGYVPFTFAGVRDPKHPALWEIRDGRKMVIDQSVHGRDFWQADYDPVGGAWAITYNISLDTPDDRPKTRRFIFQAAERSTPDSASP